MNTRLWITMLAAMFAVAISSADFAFGGGRGVVVVEPAEADPVLAEVLVPALDHPVVVAVVVRVHRQVQRSEVRRRSVILPAAGTLRGHRRQALVPIRERGLSRKGKPRKSAR